MAARFAQPADSFGDTIATRSLARFYAWIVAGLVILYLITFPIFKLPILVTVPIVVVAWFYYWRTGLIASILAFVLNFLLMIWFTRQSAWNMLFDLKSGFLVGHILVAAVSMMVGYSRRGIESIFQLNQRLQSQERFLSLSNMIVKKILSSNKPEQLFDDIVNHLTNLFVADCGCVTRWDRGQGKVFLIAATNSMNAALLNNELTSNDVRITEEVLQTGQVLLIEDVEHSPYTASLFNLMGNSQQVHSALCVPLVAREYKFGAAILAYETPHHFTDENKIDAERIGYQIALALWTVRQDEISLQQLNETRTLMQIGQTLGQTESVGLTVVLQLIVDSARQLIPQSEKSVIHLADQDNQFLVPRATSGFSASERIIPNLKMQIGNGVAGQVLRDGITINLADINEDPRFIQMEVKPNYRSLLVAPIQTASTRLGTISVESAQPQAFTDHEAELLKALGNQAAIAIENTRLFESTQQRLKEVNALYEISQGLTASLDADQLIQDVLTMLQQNFGYYYVQIYLLDPSSGELIFKRGSDEIGTKLFEQGFRLPRGKGIIGYVTETGIPFVTNNVNDVVFFYRNPLLPNTQSELAVPIKLEGKVVGVLDIQHELPHQLSDGDLQLMTVVADQLAVALQKASLYANLQRSLQQEQTIRSQLLQSERLALVGRLLASVSHELNNPLQAIQNALFLLKEEVSFSRQGSQDLGIILSETERMAAMIERLRSAYRPVRMQDFQSVELNNLVEDVYALIATHMRHKQIAFEFFPDAQLPPVRGIADQIRQVVLNLFLNAIEVMKPGGCLTVQTWSLLSENEVLLCVKDTGPGIAPEILSNIFEPFITNKPTGTGLGLSITLDIIQQHHGRIEAENNSEGGALFKVWLPISEEIRV